MPADIILNHGDIEIIENVRLLRSSGRAYTILLDSENGNIVLGGDSRDGDLILKDRGGDATILLSADSANVNLGGSGADGDLVLKNRAGDLTIHLNGEGGNLHLGGSGQDGDLILYDAAGEQVMHLNGSGGNLHLGARSHEGDLFIYDNNGRDSIHLNSQAATMRLGHRDNGGRFQILGDDGSVVISGDDTGRLTCHTLDADVITLAGIGDLATKIADLEAGSPSDGDLKDDIRPVEDAPAVVEKLVGARYTWKQETEEKSGRERVGLVAQQVREVLPEAVTEDSKGHLRVDYNAVVALLVETVKVQAQQIDEQRVQLSLLQDRVSRLEARS